MKNLILPLLIIISGQIFSQNENTCIHEGCYIFLSDSTTFTEQWYEPTNASRSEFNAHIDNITLTEPNGSYIVLHVWSTKKDEYILIQDSDIIDMSFGISSGRRSVDLKNGYSLHFKVHNKTPEPIADYFIALYKKHFNFWWD